METFFSCEELTLTGCFLLLLLFFEKQPVREDPRRFTDTEIHRRSCHTKSHGWYFFPHLYSRWNKHLTRNDGLPRCTHVRRNSQNHRVWRCRWRSDADIIISILPREFVQEQSFDMASVLLTVGSKHRFHATRKKKNQQHIHIHTHIYVYLYNTSEKC